MSKVHHAASSSRAVGFVAVVLAGFAWFNTHIGAAGYIFMGLLALGYVLGLIYNRQHVNDFPKRVASYAVVTAFGYLAQQTQLVHPFQLLHVLLVALIIHEWVLITPLLTQFLQRVGLSASEAAMAERMAWDELRSGLGSAVIPQAPPPAQAPAAQGAQQQAQRVDPAAMTGAGNSGGQGAAQG